MSLCYEIPSIDVGPAYVPTAHPPQSQSKKLQHVVRLESYFAHRKYIRTFVQSRVLGLEWSGLDSIKLTSKKYITMCVVPCI